MIVNVRTSHVMSLLDPNTSISLDSIGTNVWTSHVTSLLRDTN